MTAFINPLFNFFHYLFKKFIFMFYTKEVFAPFFSGSSLSSSI